MLEHFNYFDFFYCCVKNYLTSSKSVENKMRNPTKGDIKVTKNRFRD